jgi:hypothetical protein
LSWLDIYPSKQNNYFQVCEIISSLSLGLEAILDKHRYWFPDQSDFEGAINAVFRVQDIFQVKALDLANDKVPSATRGFPMMANDAFEIGKLAYEDEKYKQAQKWLAASALLWKEGRRTGDDDIAEILDYLSFVEYKVSCGKLRRYTYLHNLYTTSTV